MKFIAMLIVGCMVGFATGQTTQPTTQQDVSPVVVENAQKRMEKNAIARLQKENDKLKTDLAAANEKLADRELAVSMLEKQIEKLKSDLARFQKPADVRLKDDIAQAIRENRLILGMTKEDCDRAMQQKGKIQSQDQRDEVYSYSVRFPDGELQKEYEVTFTKKVASNIRVSYEKIR